MFRFGHPFFLYGLLLIPVLVILYLLASSWKKKAMNRFGEHNIITHLLPDLSGFKPVLKIILFLTAYTFLIIGIADPQIGSKLETVKKNGIDLMIAVDVSNSMLCEDVIPNRLERAK